MTGAPEARGAPPTGPVIARIMIRMMGTGIVSGVGLPWLFAQMLDLDAAQLKYVQTAFLIGIVAIHVVTFVGLRIGLRGVAGAPPTDENAQRRVLRLPVRLAAALTIFGGATTGLAMLFRLFTTRDPVTLIFGVGLTAAALVSFLAVPLYVRVRATLRPHALFFARERLPTGRRIPIGFMAGYTVIAVAALGLVPAAVFGNVRLAAARERAANERAFASARRIARAVEDLSPFEAARLVSHMHLEHASVLLRMPSGQILPEERSAELTAAAGVEAPLGGELRGGAIRIVSRPAPHAQASLLLVALGLIGVAILVASSLVRTLTRDARGVTSQVEALAEGGTPDPVPTVSSSEVRRVTLAVNRLLDRIPRLQLEKFLAVERADESRRLKSMFLANMSHDLRSPLNSILGFSELLTRGLEGPITEGQKDILQGIHGTGSNLLRLLSEILDTARAESGNLDLDRQLTPPTTFVTQARKEALRGRPDWIADRLTIDLQAGTGAVRVDSLRMQQALTHVLNWAIDAAHAPQRAGSQKSFVRVEIGDRDRPTGRAFVIEVSCDRPTTAEEESRLFQAFRKVEGVPGLHLALPLARRIVEAHGGQLEPLGPTPTAQRTPAERAASADRPMQRLLGVRLVLSRGTVSASLTPLGAGKPPRR